MTFGRFIYKNALRNKRRTGLTILSIGFSIFLLIMLYGLIDVIFSPPPSDKSNLRLAVSPATSIFEGLPLSYMQRLEKVPHVTAVLPFQFFMGTWQREPTKPFPCSAVDPAKFLVMFPELRMKDEVKARFPVQKNAAVVGSVLLEAMDWKVGQRLSVESPIPPAQLEVEIIGTYDADYRSSSFFLRFDYLSDAVGDLKAVNTYWLMADSPETLPGIAEHVDAMFHNSAAETRTQTEKAFILGFMSMLGNIKFLVGSISVVVVFTMLLVAASNMAMTVRERLREIAILKAMGYPRRVVLALIIGEAMFISFLGGAIACAFGFGISQIRLYEATQGLIEQFSFPLVTNLYAVTAGLLIGLFSAFIPALSASRLTIVEGLRRLD